MVGRTRAPWSDAAVIPISHDSGFRLALAAAERGDAAALAAWFRENAVVVLDAEEREALAHYIEGAQPKRPSHRARALTASQRGLILAAYRALYRLPQSQRVQGDVGRLHNALARRYRVGRRTLESLAAAARRLRHLP